jgi:hypothetical protein
LFPDLPQGLLKKIELNLLLADLAFERRNSALRPGLLLRYTAATRSEAQHPLSRCDNFTEQTCCEARVTFSRR